MKEASVSFLNLEGIRQKTKSILKVVEEGGRSHQEGGRRRSGGVA